MCLLKKRNEPRRSGLCLVRLNPNLKSSWSHHFHRVVCLLCGHLCLTQCAWLYSAGHSQPWHGQIGQGPVRSPCVHWNPEPGMSCPAPLGYEPLYRDSIYLIFCCQHTGLLAAVCFWSTYAELSCWVPGRRSWGDEKLLLLPRLWAPEVLFSPSWVLPFLPFLAP